MSKSISKNILYLLCIQGGNYIFPLLLFPYLAKILGVVEFGILSYCQAITQYFLLLTDFGFNLSATRRVAMARDDEQKLSTVYSSTTVMRLILTALASVILLGYILLSYDQSSHALVLAASFLGVVGNALFPIWLFQGVEQMRVLMFTTLASRLVSFVLIILFVRDSGDTAIAAMCLASSNLFLAGAAFKIIRSRKIVYFTIPKWASIKDTFFDTFPIFRSNLVTSFYLNLSPILLATFHGAAHVGQFSAADKMRMAAQAAMLPVVQSFYPSIAHNSQVSPQHAKELLNRAKVILCIIALGAFVVLEVFAKLIVGLLFGEQFAPAADLLRLEGLLVPITAISLLYGQLGMIAAGKARELSAIYVFVGLVHLVYAIPLTMYYASKGTILSIILTEALASFAVYWKYKQLVKPQWAAERYESNIRPV